MDSSADKLNGNDFLVSSLVVASPVVPSLVFTCLVVPSLVNSSSSVPNLHQSNSVGNIPPINESRSYNNQESIHMTFNHGYAWNKKEGLPIR